MDQDELTQDLALKLDLANMELQTIDEVLARRPALGGLKHRTEKIERMCSVNGELLATLQNVYNYLIGLHAYLLSCENDVIVANLESTSAFAYKTAELCDAAIRKAKGE